MESTVRRATQAAVSGVQHADASRLALQTLILKKALEAQRQQSADAMKLIEGKGHLLDIRV